METILLVEDSKFLRIATERALSNAGYTVIAVGDGEEAVLQASLMLPNLVLLDMMIPKLSGPEVLHALKKNSATAHIPVVVLSSLSKKNEEKLMQEGAAAFLEKGPLLENPSLRSKPSNQSWQKKSLPPRAYPSELQRIGRWDLLQALDIHQGSKILTGWIGCARHDRSEPIPQFGPLRD